MSDEIAFRKCCNQQNDFWLFPEATKNNYYEGKVIANSSECNGQYNFQFNIWSIELFWTKLVLTLIDENSRIP